MAELVQVAVGVSALIGAWFAVRKAHRWLRPVRISPGVLLVFDGSRADEIQATVTNLSAEQQFVVRCQARSTYPLATTVRRHLRHPMIRPRLYQNVRFSTPSFDLLPTDDPLRLEPNQPEALSHRLSNHPLSLFLTPMLLVELELSTGGVFRSRRIVVPARWRFKPVQSKGDNAPPDRP